MGTSRRVFLSISGATVAAVAGCVGVEDDEEQSQTQQPEDSDEEASDDTEPDQKGEESDEEEEESKEEDEEEKRPSPDERLDDRTTAVVADARWFSEEHPELFRTFRDDVSELTSAISELAESDEIDPDNVAVLQSDLDELVDFAKEFRPYYITPLRVRQGQDNLADAQRFAGVNDIESARTALEDARRNIRLSPSEVERISPDPFQNQLLTHIAGDDSETELLVELHHPGDAEEDEFRDWGYVDTSYEEAGEPTLLGEPASTINGTTRTASDTSYKAQMGPVSIADGRETELRLVISEFEEQDSLATTALDSSQIYVQTYESPDMAADAREQMFAQESVFEMSETAVTYEETAVEWTHIAYGTQTETLYALLRQVGPHVIVAGAGSQPVDRRGEDWTATLEQSWLWVPPREEEDD